MKEVATANGDLPRPGADRGCGIEAARGTFWIGGGQIFRQVLAIVTSVTLARLLAPEDFGLITMAYVFVELAQLFTDFGIGAAIVQARERDSTALSSAFWANAAAGCVLAIVTAVAAPVIAAFYGDPRLLPIVLALSMTLVLGGLLAIPRAILFRDLRFDRIIQAQMVGGLAGTIAAITLAVRGFGVWSLVWQPIIASGATVVLTALAARWSPQPLFSWARIRRLFSYGMDVLASDVLNYVGRNGDKLLVGKILGGTALGYYGLAFQIMLYPVTHVTGVVARVLFPTLSVLKEDKTRMQQACLKAAAAVALFTFPMMFGLVVVAEDFILVVFGETWMPMRPILQALAVVGMVQSVTGFAETIFLSVGRTRTMVRIGMAAAPLTLGAIFIGVSGGVVGVALAYAIVTVAFAYISIAIALRAIALRLRDFHFALARPFAASVLMAVTVWVVQGIVAKTFGANAPARLGIMVAAGMALYGAAMLVIGKPQITELWRLASASLTRRLGDEKGA